MILLLRLQAHAQSGDGCRVALVALGRERALEVGRAYANAAEPPLRIAEAATDVAELAAHVAHYAEPTLHADAVAAGLVAAGCAPAAAELVNVNLTVSAKDDRVRKATLLAEEAARSAEAARAARE